MFEEPEDWLPAYTQESLGLMYWTHSLRTESRGGMCSVLLNVASPGSHSHTYAVRRATLTLLAPQVRFSENLWPVRGYVCVYMGRCEDIPRAVGFDGHV